MEQKLQQINLPVGNYEMNDGTVLVVTEEGKIGELREASDEVPQKEEAGEEKEEMNEEEEMDEEADVADWQGMEKRIQNLEDAIADLKANKLNDNEEMYSKEKKDEKVEASKVDSNKLDLSAEPISHNPEKEVKKQRVKLGNNRPMTTREKIIQIINNN